MVDGIRAGAEGLRLMSLRLDNAAANIANASTTGYKKDEIAAGISSADDGEAVKTSGYIDLSQGELVKTNNPFDLALAGEGFFSVGQGDGAGFTRDGRFSMDASGQLVAADGLPVQGKNGTIVLNPALETSISGDGSVTQAGRLVDQLKVVKFENPGLLRKTGNGLLNGGGTAADAQAGVRQGFIEGSNVKMVEEMASMMQVMRGFESIQKAMTAQDSATGKLIASMGR